MDNSPISCVRALRIAARDSSLRLGRHDWEMLQCLYWAKKGVTLSYLVRQFNANTKPHYSRLNSWFYMSTERLVKGRYVEESRTPKGWRKWQITTAGMAAINQLNKEALKILEEDQE